jgi:hypothetical protein
MVAMASPPAVLFVYSYVQPSLNWTIIPPGLNSYPNMPESPLKFLYRSKVALLMFIGRLSCARQESDVEWCTNATVVGGDEGGSRQRQRSRTHSIMPNRCRGYVE